MVGEMGDAAFFSIFLRLIVPPSFPFFFFLNDPPPPEISTLPLHDALPISQSMFSSTENLSAATAPAAVCDVRAPATPQLKRAVHSREPDQTAFALEDSESQATPTIASRSEEHTSELQSQSNLVCRLLLEKK